MKFRESMTDLQQFMDSLIEPGEDKGIVAFACDGTTGKKPVYCVNLSGRYELASMAIMRVLCGKLPVTEDQKATLYSMLRTAFGWFVENAPVEVFVQFFNLELMKSIDARFNELEEKLKDIDKHEHAENK